MAETIPSNSNYIREELLAFTYDRRLIGLDEAHVVGAYTLLRTLGITHEQAMQLFTLFLEHVACQHCGPSKFYTPPNQHGYLVGKGLVQNFYDFVHMYPEGMTEFFKVKTLPPAVVEFLELTQYDSLEELR